jgi:endonuclease/exonuclease/phosphatase family metal-dependent hydrolase
MKIKVLNYNIQSTIGADGVADWKRTAEMIRGLDADVVALEETGINHWRAPGVDIPERIAGHLGMNVIFGKAVDFYYDGDKHSQYGIAALSKYKLELVEKVFLPIPDEEQEPRCFIIVKVLAPKPFYLIVTHFSFQGEFENDDDYRLESARMITATVQDKKYLPAILCGDLNTVRGMPAINYLHEYWDVCNDFKKDISTINYLHERWDAEPDIPTAVSKKRGPCQIDFICTHPKKTFSLESFTITPDQTVSDHKPVSAVLNLD